MPYTNLSDAQTIAATSPVTVQAAGTARMGWVDMAAYNRVQFVVSVGGLGTSGTVDAVIQQATDTSGTGAKALTTTKTATQITASNKGVVINVKGTELDVNNSFRYVSVLMTVATSSAQLAGLILGEPESTPPAAPSGYQVIT